MCQIDVVQRLRYERDVVQKALRNLPKSLDETYDRIFLTIPEEDRPFVYHALQWIRFHNKLYGGRGIPVEVLIQAAEKSLVRLTASHLERFHDMETIRELCGCLINITMEKSIYHSNSSVIPSVLAVSFAHYLVREYLDSSRMS